MVKHTLIVLCIFLGAEITLSAQGRFDRKIIISDSTFYAVEIQEQIGILWKGSINQPLDSAERFVIPAGTKRRSIYLQPFAWDISNDTLFAINFTEFAQNDRRTSLKSIPLDSLKKFTSATPINKYLFKAAFENSVVENYPFIETYKNNLYMDDLFFDIAVKGDSIYEFIAINNQIVMWLWDGKVWNKSATFPFETKAFFSLAYFQNDIHVIAGTGDRYIMRHTFIPIGSNRFDMTQTIMLENRDTKTLHFIKADACNNTNLSVQELVNQFTIN